MRLLGWLVYDGCPQNWLDQAIAHGKTLDDEYRDDPIKTADEFRKWCFENIAGKCGYWPIELSWIQTDEAVTL